MVQGKQGRIGNIEMAPIDPTTMPKTTIPDTRPPAEISLPLFVLMVRCRPPLNETETGELVLVSVMLIRTIAEGEIGTDVVD